MNRLRLVVLAAVVVTSTSATAAGCSPPQQPASPAPTSGHTWNPTHRVDLPTGWTVTARNVGLDSESTSLVGPGSQGCLVQTWSDRPRRPARPRWPDQVQVQGHHAAYGSLDPDYGRYPRAVIWRGAQQRWFSVSCDLDRTGILALAERVRSAGSPLLVPFRLSSPPDGVALVELIESSDGDARTVSAQFEMAGSSSRLVMQVSNGPDPSTLPGPVERQQINGHDAEVRTAAQTICLRTVSAPICVSGPGDEPATDWSPEARRVAQQTAERLSPAQDPDDQSTWWEAEEAFPW